MLNNATVLNSLVFTLRGGNASQDISLKGHSGLFFHFLLAFGKSRDGSALTGKEQLSDRGEKGQNNRSSTVPHNAFVQETSPLNQANAGSACLYRGRRGGGGHRRGSFVLHIQTGKLEHGAFCIPTPPLLKTRNGKIYTA